MAEVELRGCTFSYDVAGGGEGATPFVWGHGLTSSRADEDVQPLVDTSVLARTRPVLRYDARGHGRSGDLATPEQGAWSELGVDQVALIDHLGWDDVIIGGASMGTATALHAALELGARVRGLVLVIPPTAWETRAEQIENYARMADLVLEHGVDVLLAGMRVMPPPDPFVDDDTWMERRAAALTAAAPERLAAVFRGAGHADLPAPDDIATITAPTLVLAWTGDAGHPASTAERLGELLPNSEVVISSTRDDLDTWTSRTAAFLDGR